jgi:hypothetical protein
MVSSGHTGRRRIGLIGLVAIALAVVGWLGAGAALGAGSTQPSMEVLPKTTGLKYSQTVEIKGHHLPKGSGSVAATICGLNDSAGKTIAKPTADDCAGAPEIGKLVVVKSWQSNGEFDTKYTLPASGKTFGKNARFCDHSHHCALVVADANPNNPAYHVETTIQFFDQTSTTPTTKPKPATTKPAPTKTGSSSTAPKSTPQNNAPTPGATAGGSTTTSGNSNSGSVSFKANASVSIPAPSAGGGATPSLPPLTLPTPPANPVPAPAAQALQQVCTQLANAVKSAGGDPSGLLLACSTIASGNGPQQLPLVLQSPSLLCVLGASAWQNNPQVTDACNQAAAALAPVTSQVGAALGPVLGSL